jgi:hypothetical protein
MSPQMQTTQGRTVQFADRVKRGITGEVLTAFNAVPRRGAETGGILLGRTENGEILIEDFEPVLCQHRFGPSYHLDDDDLRGLEESLEWFRSRGDGAVEVLGWYRSQTRPEFAPDERDGELIRRFYPQPRSLFLLLKPNRNQTIAAALFSSGEGELRALGEPAPFPPDAPIRLPMFSIEPAAAELPAPAATRKEPANRHWIWAPVVVAVVAIAAAFGYRSLRPLPDRPPIPVARTPVSSVPAAPVPEHTVVPTPAAAAPEPASVPPPAAVAMPESVAVAPPSAAPTTAEPEPSEPIEERVRAAIAQWVRAIRTGKSDLIAACYAPQLRENPGQQFAAKYGRLAILRLSDLSITAVSKDRAIAIFRKHWQTAGPAVSAGEEQDRLTLVRIGNSWKIASEEETQVYWMHRVP